MNWAPGGTPNGICTATICDMVPAENRQALQRQKACTRHEALQEDQKTY